MPRSQANRAIHSKFGSSKNTWVSTRPATSDWKNGRRKHQIMKDVFLFDELSRHRWRSCVSCAGRALLLFCVKIHESIWLGRRSRVTYFKKFRFVFLSFRFARNTRSVSVCMQFRTLAVTMAGNRPNWNGNERRKSCCEMNDFHGFDLRCRNIDVGAAHGGLEISIDRRTIWRWWHSCDALSCAPLTTDGARNSVWTIRHSPVLIRVESPVDYVSQAIRCRWDERLLSCRGSCCVDSFIRFDRFWSAICNEIPESNNHRPHTLTESLRQWLTIWLETFHCFEPTRRYEFQLLRSLSHALIITVISWFIKYLLFGAIFAT